MASATDAPVIRADESVVSPETTLAGIRALAHEGEPVVDPQLQEHRGETLALVQRLLGSAGIEVAFSLTEAKDNGTTVDVEIADADVRQLTPKAAERTLSTLEEGFSANSYLHEGCEWSRVKSALEANAEALWSISQMEAQGHMPDVYNFDDNGFDIGTCSEETPAGARNCVYDAEAEEWLKANRPNAKFNNGSAVEMAEAMGIRLMSLAQYIEGLQGKGKFDSKTRSWLLTDEATRESGGAISGYRDGDKVKVVPCEASNHDGGRGWRGSLRVSWAQLLES